MNTLTFSPAVAMTIAEQQASRAMRESSRRRLARQVWESDPLPGSEAAFERRQARRARRPRRLRLVARLGL
jgi:hypothetical protein